MKRTTFLVFFIGLLTLMVSACTSPSTGGESQPPAVSGEKDLDTLVASDPSTVTLASGEVQLVEFFAFW
ncbi:MAG: hypothetical protein HC806_02185 [Anaerolineae bacterium]|nr:hypothetical protein [Anaerolineae bacterium]